MIASLPASIFLRWGESSTPASWIGPAGHGPLQGVTPKPQPGFGATDDDGGTALRIRMQLSARFRRYRGALWTPFGRTGKRKARKASSHAGLRGGRYWARTSDPQLVELVLSQLS